MAKITALPLEETPDGSETVVLVKGGATKRAPFSSLVAAQVAPLRTINLFPDPRLTLSAGNVGYAPEGFRLFRPGTPNQTWDANLKHPYGKGAWVYNPSLSTFLGFELHFGGPGTREHTLQAGDKISLAVEAFAASGRANIAARFFSAISTSHTYVGSQITGSANVLMDGTPKVMKVENLTIPEGAIGVDLYLYDTDAYPCAFSPLRVWAVKGAAAYDGPPVRGTEWEQAERAKLAVGDPHGAAVAWAVKPAVVYDNADTVLAVTSPGPGTNSEAIRGWASVMTPAGVRFNAVRVYGLRPASATKLASCGIVVRKGAANTVHLAGAPVVAVGTAVLDDTDGAPQDVVIALRDPTTGALKTLSDADLDLAEYAVMIYGIDASGARAPIRQPSGTTSNRVARSYYITTPHPVTDTWQNVTGGTPVGVEHVMLEGALDGFSPTDRYLQQIAAQIEGGSGPDPVMPVPTLIVPPAVYAVTGQQMNVYFDNLLADDAARYLIDTAAAGTDSQQLAECWRWTPAQGRASGQMELRVCAKFDGTQLAAGVVNMRAAAANAGSGKTVKAVVIGDSQVQAGTITQTLLDLAGADVMGVELLGTRGTGANRHEGRGGWRVDDYATVGRTYYAFTVSGVTTPPAINATEYSNNGSVYRVQEVALSGGAGTIVCSRTSGSAAPSSAAPLVKTNSGAGDASITFSAASPQTANPFWHGGKVDFAEYLSSYSMDAPDWAFILLGTNDGFASTSDSAMAGALIAAMAQYKTLTDSIKAANSSTRIGIGLIPPPAAEQDAFGANYGTGQTRWRVKRNYALWNAALIRQFGDKEADGIYIVPVGPAVDTVNNYPRAAAAPINARNAAVTIARQNNGVHPAVSGYQQMADALFAVMKYFADA